MELVASMFVVAASVAAIADEHGATQPHPLQVPQDVACEGVGFIENKGQWDTPAKYVAQIPGMRLLLAQDVLMLQVFEDGVHDDRGVLVRLPLGSDFEFDELVASAPTETRFSYFYGDDPARWVQGARSYECVTYRSSTGVELEFRVRGEAVEYELLGCATTDLLAVTASHDAPLVSTGERGELLVRLAGTTRVAMTRARAMPASGGGASAEVNASGGALHWSTYLGGALLSSAPGDALWGSAAGSNDDVYVTGRAGSTDFPQTHGAYSHLTPLGLELVAAKFQGSTGKLVYCVRMGGWWNGGLVSAGQRGYAVAADALGRATYTGFTEARDFPVTAGAFDTTLDGPADACVFRLSADGTTLEYSTLMGGFWIDEAYGMALANDGGALIGGLTASDDFPTTPGVIGASDPNTSSCGFVSRLSSDGSALVFSTYIAASVADEVADVALQPSGEVTVLGWTASPDFPITPGAWNPPVPPFPSQQVFVMRLNPDATAIRWSTVFGANKNDEPQHVALDPEGGVLVAGYTYGDGFPTTPNSVQPDYQGTLPFAKGFVVRLPPDGANPIYSTYFGGDGLCELYGMDADASGSAVICGFGGPGIVTTAGSFQDAWIQSLPVQSFVARLTPDGSSVVYGTFLGGQSYDYLLDVAASPSGRVTAAGYTSSGDYPTTQNAFDPTFNGGQYDGVATCLDLLLKGVDRLGASTPACYGDPHAATDRMPLAGASNFAFVCANVPPFAKGALLLGTAASAPKEVHGAQIWIDLQQPFMRLPASSDAFGWIQTPLSLKHAAAGQQLAVQFVVRVPAGCDASTQLCASEALAITVQ